MRTVSNELNCAFLDGEERATCLVSIIHHTNDKTTQVSGRFVRKMVGARGFEPPTSRFHTEVLILNPESAKTDLPVKTDSYQAG